MTTSLMPEPRQRYYTNSGAPAAGCKLFTYAAGTTTPKAAYTDAAGLVPHTNPITLDAKGEALIYWYGNYKIDLKTAAGVQITGYPVDNFQSYDSVTNNAATNLLRADLAASTGAALAGYLPSGAGAVATTVQAQLRSIQAFRVSIQDAPFYAIQGTNADVAMAAALASGALEIDISGNFTLAIRHTLPENVTLTRRYGGLTLADATSGFALSSGSKLVSPHFTGYVATPTFAVTADGAVTNAVISDPVCTDCMLIATNESLTYAAADWAGKTNIVQKIKIENPVGVTSAPMSANAFIFTAYANDVLVIGGSAKGYFYGLCYWGGDSDFGVDGVATNTRKLDKLNVIGFNADNCEHAGLWGSMGETVTFSHCTAIRSTNGGDVGIDHEGTINASNVSCTVKNYTNGNFASFFGTKKMSLIDCTSYQIAGKAHLRNYNTSANGVLAGDISVIGGKYVNISGIAAGLATFDDANGACNSFTMKDACLVDSVVSFAANNIGSFRLVDNMFEIQGAAVGVVANLIYFKTNASTAMQNDISGNALISTGTTTFDASSRFIRVDSASSNYPQTIRVRDNNGVHLLGCDLYEFGGNGGISGVFHVHGNTFTSVAKFNSGAKAMVIARGDNNYNYLGAAVAV